MPIRKHNMLLAALMSLGLLALWTPAASAKNVNSTQHVSQNRSVQKINLVKPKHSSIKLSQNRLPVKLNGLNQSRKNVPQANQKDRPVNQNSRTVKAKVNGVNINNKMRHGSNKMPMPMYEHSHQAIGNMNRFVQFRKPYRYTKVGLNTRDLGGYVTADHKHQTKIDRIIRSAGLDGLSKTGVAALQRLHVDKVVDLRYQTGKSGIQGHPDPDELRSKNLKGTGIVYQKDPIYSYAEAKGFDHYMKDHDAHGEYYFYGAPSVTEPQAIKAYRTIFKDLLDNRHGAILFHCNLGRDRTGVTSALILSSLGVAKNVIYHDYLLTDYYHYKYHQEPYAKQAGELRYFFSTIDQKYGNVNNYLCRAIGLSKNDVHQLHLMYLVPGSKRQVVMPSQKLKHHDRKNDRKSPAKYNHKAHHKMKK